MELYQQSLSKQEPHPAITYLIPALSLESIRDSYDDIDHANDVNSLLSLFKTHILGGKGEYLLPIKLLTELNLSAEKTFLYNPYYDYAIHLEENVLVNPEEFSRLVGYSPETRALFDAKQRYESLSNDTSHLLGQLTQLIQNLKIHDASGLGEETNASGGAYPAIISFMNYYAQLEHCGLQVLENEPTIDDLPAGRNMGYVLVRTTPENTALYFINRYNEDSPVKKITNEQQPLKYALDLVTVDYTSDDINMLDTSQYSTRHPTLIRLRGKQNSYILHGYTPDHKWTLTRLDTPSVEAAKLVFPDQNQTTTQRIIHLPLGRIPQSIYDTIEQHKAHTTQTLSNYLYHLSNEPTEPLYAPIQLCSLQHLDEIKNITDHAFFSEKNRIPTALQLEINQLFELVQDSTKNINATETLATCIATRRKFLASSMKGHSSILNEISLSEEIKTTQINEVINTFNEMMTQLVARLKTPNDEGYDHLGINLKLLHELNITLQINSLEELSILTSLNAEEIKLICNNNDEINQKMIAQIKNISDFILFLNPLSPEKIEALLTASILLEHYIKTIKDLDLLFPLFDAEQRKALLNALQTKKHALYALDTLKYFEESPEMVTLILDAWDVETFAINDINDILFLLKHFSEPKKIIFYQRHEETIHAIENVDTMLMAMAVIPEIYKETFYKTKKEPIENRTDILSISYSLHYLPSPYREKYIEVMTPVILNILVNTPVSCSFIFPNLSSNEINSFFTLIKTDFIHQLKKELRYCYSSNTFEFLSHLSEEDCVDVLTALEKIFFSSVIRSQIGSILHGLSITHCQIVCQTWKGCLNKLSSTELRCDFQLLKNKQENCSIFYNSIKEKIASLLTEPDREQIMPCLSENDQLDLHYRMLLHKLEPWVSNSRLKAFESALLNEDEMDIKNAFDQLFNQKMADLTFRSFFHSHLSKRNQLIGIIACTEQSWLKKITSALSLDLTNEQLENKDTIKTALERYLTTALTLASSTPLSHNNP